MPLCAARKLKHGANLSRKFRVRARVRVCVQRQHQVKATDWISSKIDNKQDENLSTALYFAQLRFTLLNCATLYRLDVLSNPAFFFPLAKTAKLSSVAHTLLLFGVPCRAVALALALALLDLAPNHLCAQSATLDLNHGCAQSATLASNNCCAQSATLDLSHGCAQSATLALNHLCAQSATLDLPPFYRA